MNTTTFMRVSTYGISRTHFGVGKNSEWGSWNEDLLEETLILSDDEANVI